MRLVGAYIFLLLTLLFTLIVVYGIVSESIFLIEKGWPIKNILITGEYIKGYSIGEGSSLGIVRVLITLGLPFVIVMWIFSIIMLKAVAKRKKVNLV